jgi:hypothetical protein
METDPPPSPIYTVCENATLQGLQLQKACRADISIAHGVSRGLGASKEIPEAQDAFLKEAVLASGMETDVSVAVCITSLSLLSNNHPEKHAIPRTNRLKF